MKTKSSEILLRLTTSLEMFTTENLFDRHASDGITPYQGEILIADGVDEFTLFSVDEVDYAHAGDVIAFLIDIEDFVSLCKRTEQYYSDVLEVYGSTLEFSNLIKERATEEGLSLNDDTKRFNKLLFIRSVNLKPEYRGQGIGTYVITLCIDALTDKQTPVFMPVMPLQFSKYDQEAESCFLYTKHRAEADEKLRKHFQTKLLFEPIVNIGSGLKPSQSGMLMYRQGKININKIENSS